MSYAKRYLLPAVATAFLSSPALAQLSEVEQNPLPRHMTWEELQMRDSYIPPAGVAVTPPPNPVRTMAEWEELEGVTVRWAFGTQNVLLRQIVGAARQEGKVWIIVRPGTSDSTNIKSYLTSGGVPLTNIEFLSTGTNTIWIRDYGPWTVYDVTNDSMAIVDFRYNRPRPLDDVIPVDLAARWGLPIYQTVQMPDSLVHTGGNFMVDGFGTGFASRLIHQENPLQTPAAIDTVMRKYCGLHRFITMETLLYDNIHHIDMHMKLLDEETLLIGQYPVNVSDYQRIEATVDHLRTLQNAYGRPYRIIRIPMPPSATGNYPPNSSYFTYTNSLIVNKTVLVPVYGFALDATALQIYRDAMPGYNVIGYDCNAIIGQSGAIHCIVKEVGVREPVLIAHARLDDTADTTAAHRIEATIRVRSGVDSAFVFWRTDSTAAFTASQMTDSAGAFIAEIPPQPAGTPVWYYIQSHTGTGRAVTKPVTGAQGAYKFTVLDTTVTSVRGGEQPLLFTLSQNYPNPFNPSTTIGFQVTAYSHVRLSIYDLLGREVATLVNRQMEPGSYHAEWNATGVASGVYVIRLVATAANGSTHIAARKAMLMK